MAATTTTSSNFADLVAINVNALLEDALRHRLVWATPDSYLHFAHRAGTSSFFAQAYGDLAYSSNSATLTEGSYFSAIQPISINYDSFSAVQKGTVMGVSDLAQFTSPADLVGVMSEKIARWGAEGIDWTLHAAIDAAVSTSIEIFGGTATSRATVGSVANGFGMNGLFLKNLVGRMRQANIPCFPNGNYRAIISPRQYFDLSTDTATASLQDLSKYTQPNADLLLAGQVGTFAGVDLLQTTVATTFATAGAGGVDVIRGVIFGPQAFGMGDVTTLQIIPVLQADHADPLGQVLLMGAKFWCGATALKGQGAKYIAFETSGTPLAAGQA